LHAGNKTQKIQAENTCTVVYSEKDVKPFHSITLILITRLNPQAFADVTVHDL